MIAGAGGGEALLNAKIMPNDQVPQKDVVNCGPLAAMYVTHCILGHCGQKPMYTMMDVAAARVFMALSLASDSIQPWFDWFARIGYPRASPGLLYRNLMKPQWCTGGNLRVSLSCM